MGSGSSQHRTVVPGTSAGSKGAQVRESKLERAHTELEAERGRVKELEAALQAAESALEAAQQERSTGLSAARAEAADANLRIEQLEKAMADLQASVDAGGEGSDDAAAGPEDHESWGKTRPPPDAEDPELRPPGAVLSRRRGSHDGHAGTDDSPAQKPRMQGRRHSMPVASDMREVATRWRGGRDRLTTLQVLEEGFLRKHPKGFGVELAELKSVSIEAVWLLPVPNLAEYAEPAKTTNRMGIGRDKAEQQEYNKLLGREDVILHDIVRKPDSKPITTAYLRAGPRPLLHFEPSAVRAAIVTCGGLCPGLNNIIQGITRTLLDSYGAKEVLGVRGGYQGFADGPTGEPIPLTLETVQGIHKKGGTRIGSGRGSFDLDKTISWLQKHEVDHLYVVGGDGTHRAATKIADEARARKLNIAVCGVPKTIDNDIDLLDRSFGFNTAVEEAQKAIRSAHVEARCNVPNGIGIVKLMGRHSGYIAVHATLCSSEVDLCLIPEVDVVTEGPNGCFPHIERALERKGYAVIVVAEGAGEEILGQSATVDAGGNRKLPELGVWLKDELGRYFKSRERPVTVKYIDPSYMIRSVAANANDAIYCLLLSQNAVHGTMVCARAPCTAVAWRAHAQVPVRMHLSCCGAVRVLPSSVSAALALTTS